MKKSSKGQITIFVIVAVIIIASIGSLVYLSKNKDNGMNKSPVSELNVPKATENLKTERDNCIKKLTIEGLDLYGLNQDAVTAYLQSELKDCINPIIEVYQQTFTVTPTMKSISVVIDNNEIKTNVDFTIIIEKDGKSGKIDKYSDNIQRLISKKLNHDSNCIITEDAGFFSFDEKFEIFISKGTQATKSNGNCLEEITIRLEDPQISYNNRATSLTSIVYIPGPLGAEFDKPVKLNLKYSEKDYADYYRYAYNLNQYVLSEEQLRIEYYDPLTNNYYVYPEDGDLKNSVVGSKKVINAEVEQFYGADIPVSSTCQVQKETIIESSDRRMSFILSKNTAATNEDGSCLKKAEIQIKSKLSKVVNFGYGDYELLPSKAMFTPYAYLIYKYTEQEAKKPEFLYGYSNWEDLITGTWTSPVVVEQPQVIDNGPIIDSLKAVINNSNVTFSFRVIDDFSKSLLCSLYINNSLSDYSIVSNKNTANFTKELIDGVYNWSIGCSDSLNNETKSDLQFINISENKTKLNFIYTIFASIAKNIVLKNTPSGITGLAVSDPSNDLSGYTPRDENELKIAYYNEEDGVYRPWPTKVDKEKRTITAEITHFSINIASQGCEDVSYAYMQVAIEPRGGEEGTGVRNYRIEANEACLNTEDSLKIVLKKYSGADRVNTISIDKVGRTDWGLSPDVYNWPISEDVTRYTKGGDHQIGAGITDMDGVKATGCLSSDCGFASVEAYIYLKGIGMKYNIGGNEVEYAGREVSGEELVSLFKGDFKVCEGGSEESIAGGATFGSDSGGCCDSSADTCDIGLCEACAAEVMKGYFYFPPETEFYEHTNICVRGENNASYCDATVTTTS